MRTVRIAVATVVVVLVLATYALVHSSGRTTKLAGVSQHNTVARGHRIVNRPLVLVLHRITKRLTTTDEVDTTRVRSVAARENAMLIQVYGALHEEQVAHALTAIDEFGRYLDEVRAAADGLVPSALIPVDTALWERLHNCEQPDTWYASGSNPDSESGVVFQGGLGMSVGAWQMAVQVAAGRGVSLPRSALVASVYQQMVGAQAFHDAYGWGWGCSV